MMCNTYVSVYCGGVLVFFKWNPLERLRAAEYSKKTWALKAWSERGVHKVTVKFTFKDKKHVSCLPLINVCCCILDPKHVDAHVFSMEDPSWFAHRPIHMHT